MQVFLCSRNEHFTWLVPPTKRLLQLLVVLLSLGLVLVSCGPSNDFNYQNPTPVTTVQLSYPRSIFHEAAHTLAAAFDQAIQAGYAGAVITISLLTSNSYDPANTIQTFRIPPVPLYPRLIRHHSTDPYIDGQLAKEDERVYQQQVQAFQDTVEHIRAQVRPFLTRLAELDPLVDMSRKVDVWGAWNRAAEHLQGGKTPKYLIFVSSLTNDTWQEFIPLQGFWGTQTHVRVDWYFCTDAPSCQQNTEFWQGAFQHGGVIESQFNDPVQSRKLALTNYLLA